MRTTPRLRRRSAPPVSHQVRLHVAPRESLSWGLIGYSFLLDQSIGSGVTSRNLATELDAYADWELNDNFSLSVVAAWAKPGAAVTQALGRTDNFHYGMLYLTYSY